FEIPIRPEGVEYEATKVARILEGLLLRIELSPRKSQCGGRCTKQESIAYVIIDGERVRIDRGVPRLESSV
ncbi:hypothetical protein A2U01_0107866, partial [Trifolium medium]|nr:hypothetical protein [Trifolium medium]